ncbi:MAG: indole-3-glycerol phosphate synthase TrpC [Planctomycetota bacterium]|nr:indole-3-glycerol phosphate synthase TrpC [Planctomycetota bacterium]
MPNILDDILAVKRDEVAALQPRMEEFQAACRDAPPVRSLAEALRRTPLSGGSTGGQAASGTRSTESQSEIRNPKSEFGGPIRILAEVKHRSPSAGVISDPFRPADIARAYQGGGADAVSCLTDERFFGGSIAHLREVRAAVDLPLLRKDFLIDAVQVFEARAAGADAVLLIAEALEPAEMADLAAMARGLGMDILAEAHGEAALEAAVGCGAPLVGINNRDLATFTVNLATTEHLAPRVREAGRVLVAESGIKTAADVSRLLACGCDAILVGEGLLRSGDVAGKLAEFKAAR